MILYIMRHGEAEPRANSDRERRLTEDGEAEVAIVANGFRQQVGTVSRILCSPYERTVQTAGLMVAGLEMEFDTVEFCEELSSGADVHEVMDWLTRELDGDTLLIGHFPCVAELANLLIEGSRQGSHEFHTASLLALETEDVAPGNAELLWQRTPEDW